MKSTSIKILVAAALIAALVVIVIPSVRDRSQCVSMGGQWMSLLKKHPTFSGAHPEYPIDVNFFYAHPTEANLTRLRDTYELETVAGQGSEVNRIINLMSWVYQLTGHANNPAIPEERNAFTFIDMAKCENKQINCYMKTVILNEVYLSMGFRSRHTHLLPHSNEEEASHFITSVYAPTLEKWILMDPDFGVYVTDDEGTILGISEIRSRMIAGEPLKTVHVGRNSLAIAWTNLSNSIEGADYIWFLSDFIFKIRCPKNSMFDQDSKPLREYFELIPDGYHRELLQGPRMMKRGKKIFYMNDECLFWQKPADSTSFEL